MPRDHVKLVQKSELNAPAPQPFKDLNANLIANPIVNDKKPKQAAVIANNHMSMFVNSGNIHQDPNGNGLDHNMVIDAAGKKNASVNDHNKPVNSQVNYNADLSNDLVIDTLGEDSDNSEEDDLIVNQPEGQQNNSPTLYL
ncbi:MAG: hypothetical protein GY782_11935 [Gammaproteobacteria bacterium]|nr:hypothetical protein [Gammaproteobacteria bacterium]